jgi:hypothetical protein
MKKIQTLLQQRIDLVAEIKNLKAHRDQLVEEKKHLYEKRIKEIKGIYRSRVQKMAEDTHKLMEAQALIRKQIFAPSEEELEQINVKLPRFLEQFILLGNIKEACRKTPGLKPHTIYYLRKNRPEFKADFEIAKEMYEDSFKDTLSNTIRKRAIEGTPTPIIHRGEETGSTLQKDNRLLESVAKAHLPEIYDRKSFQDKDDKQINIQINSFSPQITDDSLPLVGNVLSISDDGTVIKQQED